MSKPITSAFHIDVNSLNEIGEVGTLRSAVLPGFSADVSKGDHVWVVDADDLASVAIVTGRTGDWIGLLLFDADDWKHRALHADHGPCDTASSDNKGETR